MDELAWAARVWVRGGGYGVGCAAVYAPVAAVVSVVSELAQGIPAFGLGGVGGSVSTFVVVLMYALLVASPVGLVAGVLVASVAAALRRRVRPERLAVGLVVLLWTAAALLAARLGLPLTDPTATTLFLLAPAPLSAVAAHLCCRDLPVRAA